VGAAYPEDESVIIFDESAEKEDPKLKGVSYSELLP